MTQSVRSTAPPVSEPAARVIGTPELIDRLAEELRSSSDVDLPHSYFVEQVKLRLAGSTDPDRLAANAVESRSPAYSRKVSASVFQAWAMPD
ncbi:hypothetical protein FE840_016345 [Peteryoungia desertarenae]|uniref:Uncharacterized protein n=1 Tax=Peteryoungia desertarenae TaxID=1813451 RepID=A0ABX6QS44_9HYPH|nr:hypothetical protein [Peteryoungia desertarenae]QLF70990.1 hypothetical protein FE840_016345 [Peteryoungia desertarenae]